MTIKTRKQKAIEFFLQRLNDKDKRNISRIVLFGSMVWGKPERDSDVDLMVFTKKPNELEKKIHDLTYDILLDCGETIEPQIYPEKEYQNPSSYFVWQALNKGKKIYDRKTAN